MGIRFSGEFIEPTLGKLINITEGGGGNALPGNGTILEFDINTNTLTKKIEFNGDNLGSVPKPYLAEIMVSCMEFVKTVALPM